MAKNKKRTILTTEEKTCRAIQAIFILQARQADMRSAEIREILGVDKTEVSAVAKLVNKALRKTEKTQ